MLLYLCIKRQDKDNKQVPTKAPTQRQGKANGYGQTDTHKHAKQAKTNRQAPNRHKAQSIYKKRTAVSCAKNIPFLAFVLVMMDNNQQTTANTIRMRKKPQKTALVLYACFFCTQKHTQKPQYRRDTSALCLYLLLYRIDMTTPLFFRAYTYAVYFRFL